MLNLSGFTCFIERGTQNFILKFRNISLWRETVLSTHGMKSDEKLIFCRIYAIIWEKIAHVMIDRYFSLFLKGYKIFLNPWLSLIVPLKASHLSINNYCNFCFCFILSSQCAMALTTFITRRLVTTLALCAYPGNLPVHNATIHPTDDNLHNCQELWISSIFDQILCTLDV